MSPAGLRVERAFLAQQHAATKAGPHRVPVVREVERVDVGVVLEGLGDGGDVRGVEALVEEDLGIARELDGCHHRVHLHRVLHAIGASSHTACRAREGTYTSSSIAVPPPDRPDWNSLATQSFGLTFDSMS